MPNTFMIGNNSAEQLKAYIERAENVLTDIEKDKEALRDIFSEAKGTGFDVKTMKEIIKLRKKDPADLEEEKYLLDTYKRALNMLPQQRNLFSEEDNIGVTKRE